jgi:hypothetical protein
MRGISKAALIGLASMWLAACGGGGGGSSEPALHLSQKSIAVSATTDDSAPTAEIGIELDNIDEETPVYISYGYDGGAISALDLYATDVDSGVMLLYLLPPSGLTPGTYRDRVQVQFCSDEECSKPFKGSPATVNVTYTVTQGTRPSASISVPASASSSSEVGTGPSTLRVPITIANSPSGGLSFTASITSGTSTISNAYISAVNANTAELAIDFNYGLAEGIYQGTVSITACYTYDCSRYAQGSPATVTINYTVTPDLPAQPDRPVLPTSSVQSLGHDVIDAEYSAALDAVVMVSSYPRNQLFLYSLASGTEQALPLDKVPTSVSVAPNGLTAAVGHDALITHVDLTRIATPIAAKKLLNVSTGVLDIVLDGKGWVHAFPLQDQWESIYSVEVATNKETPSAYATIYAGTRAKLHPSGNAIYGANNGLSPDDIERYDISTGPVTSSYDSPYHGTYPMCGDLWMSEDGVHIYTACGRTFRSSNVQSQDMVYNGSLTLSSGDYYGYRIRSLSQTADMSCEGGFGSSSISDCRNYYNLYESQFFNRTASYSIAPMTIAGRSYAQFGQFVFHSSDGSKRVLISRLVSMPDPASEFYLSIVAP